MNRQVVIFFRPHGGQGIVTQHVGLGPGLRFHIWRLIEQLMLGSTYLYSRSLFAACPVHDSFGQARLSL